MPKTEEMPLKGDGVEVPVIPELDSLIKKYEKKKAARCAESPGEIDAKKELRAGLMKHAEKLPKNDAGEHFYRFEIEDGVFKDYTLSEILKVTKVKAEDEE
jgi:hypothetical protein